jgi:nitrile hydratase
MDGARDSAHDMGGKAVVTGTDGSRFDLTGPVRPEPDEPVFHAGWERRAFGLTLAMARPGGWTLDMSRAARENRAPQDYLALSYYEIWLAGLTALMEERGLVTRDEIASGEAKTPRLDRPMLRAADVDAMLKAGGPTARPATAPARFAPGDRVRTATTIAARHTRLPAYARGRVGVIDRLHGCHVFADSNAEGAEAPQWLYTVRFDAAELFGDKAAPNSWVSVDAWDSYLEPA